MVKYFCDKCEKEIPEYTHMVSVRAIIEGREKYLLCASLCKDCYDGFEAGLAEQFKKENK